MYLSEENFMGRAAAVQKLLEVWAPSPLTETISVELALGRIPVADITARHTLPVCRSAACDGIAVNRAVLTDGIPDSRNWKLNREYAMADTGDDFSDRFDTVIAAEDLEWLDQETFLIRPQEPLTPGQYVNAAGSTLKEGELLVTAGTWLNSMHLNLLHAGGHTHIKVYRRPQIIYIPTGNELLEPGSVPERGQNIQSNGVMVEALVSGYGGTVIRYPLIRDEPSLIQAALDKALTEGDIILISGGSSKGSEDYTSRILEKQAAWWQHGIRSIPGIPVAVGVIATKPVINLPGPPFAAFCALDWCVRELIAAFQGTKPRQRPQIRARLTESVRKPPGYEFHLKVALEWNGNEYLAHPLGMDQRYADGCRSMNALAVIPCEHTQIMKDEQILVEML